MVDFRDLLSLIGHFLRHAISSNLEESAICACCIYRHVMNRRVGVEFSTNSQETVSEISPSDAPSEAGTDASELESVSSISVDSETKLNEVTASLSKIDLTSLSLKDLALLISQNK